MRNAAKHLNSLIDRSDSPLLVGQLARFIVAGCSAVAIDLCVYYLTFPVIGHSLAKLVSFASGTVVSFILNKYWTFESSRKSFAEVLAFICLYLMTMGANVLTNKLVLETLPGWFFLAFFVATGLSTVLNFLGMRYWVFVLKDA